VAVGTIEIFSNALGFPVPYNVILPDVGDVGPGPYPVLVQLHGRFDSHNSWLHKSKLVWYLQKVPLIVILPNGGNYYWTDMTPSESYEQLIVTDLWNHVNANFQVRKDTKWAIGGLSMGGFGALRIGLKHTDKFGSIYAHSSYIPQEADLMQRTPSLPSAVRTDMDIYRLLAPFTKDKQSDLPILSFDCGLKDELLEHNRRFHNQLDALKLRHQYHEYPGAHDWDFWDKYVQAALIQHCTYFKIPVPSNKSAVS
jgi:putative tributyrin esterase